MSNFTKTKCFNSGRISIAFKVNLDTGEIYWQYAKRNKKDKNDPQFGMYLAKERLKKNPIVVKYYIEMSLDNKPLLDLYYNGHEIEICCLNRREFNLSYFKNITDKFNPLNPMYLAFCSAVENSELEFHL